MTGPPRDAVVSAHHAAASRRVAVAVLTVSDSRTPDTDAGGDLARDLLLRAGMTVPWRRLVRDEAADVRRAIEDALADADVDAVVTTGGTGIAPRDVTIEAATPLFEKHLPGFGEIFRHLSYRDVGPAAITSRASAGIVRGKPVFLLPGSPAAVELAVERLIAPEIAHLAHVARRPA